MATVATSNGRMGAERTGPQLGVMTGAVYGDDALQKSWADCLSNYKLYRKMRRDPTIAFARAIAIAPIIMAGWTVEATDEAPDDAEEFITEMVMPMQIHFLRTALYGCFDYGWQPYEKVFDIKDGRIWVRKLKPLLQDNTEIMIDRRTGAYLGLRQQSEFGVSSITLQVQESLNIVIDNEGTNWYGDAVLETARDPYLSTQVVEDSANRYDKKIAGSHWVIHYPLGVSDFGGQLNVDNYTIAQEVLKTLQSSGAVIMPSTMEVVQELTGGASPELWKVELLTDQGKGTTGFIERFKYLDVLKVRAAGLPERAVLEGEYGTKAEAEAHGDFAIVGMELRHAIAVQQFNWHLVNQILRLNWGAEAENTVYVKASPINDEVKRMLKQMYMGFLQNGDLSFAEHDALDMDNIRQRLQLPSDPNVENTLVLPRAEVQLPETGPPLTKETADNG